MQVLSQQLIDDVLAVLAVSEEDLLYRGIAAAVTERLVELRRVQGDLAVRYGSLQEVERRIELRGVTPDDHTLYTDLLEWRAIRHEMAELLRIFGSL